MEYTCLWPPPCLEAGVLTEVYSSILVVWRGFWWRICENGSYDLYEEKIKKKKRMEDVCLPL